MLKTLFPFHFTKDKIKAEIKVSICQSCHPLHSSCTMNSVLQRTNPFRTFFAEQYVTFGATFHISRTLVCSQSAFFSSYCEASSDFQDPKKVSTFDLVLTYVQLKRFSRVGFFLLRGNFRASTGLVLAFLCQNYIPPQRFYVQFCAPIFYEIEYD